MRVVSLFKHVINITPSVYAKFNKRGDIQFKLIDLIYIIIQDIIYTTIVLCMCYIMCTCGVWC